MTVANHIQRRKFGIFQSRLFLFLEKKKKKTSNTKFFFNTIMIIIIFFNICNFLPCTWKTDYIFSTVKSFDRIVAIFSYCEVNRSLRDILSPPPFFSQCHCSYNVRLLPIQFHGKTAVMFNQFQLNFPAMYLFPSDSTESVHLLPCERFQV